MIINCCPFTLAMLVTLPPLNNNEKKIMILLYQQLFAILDFQFSTKAIVMSAPLLM
jgi:hypothetical protein